MRKGIKRNVLKFEHSMLSATTDACPDSTVIEKWFSEPGGYGDVLRRLEAQNESFTCFILWYATCSYFV